MNFNNDLKEKNSEFVGFSTANGRKIIPSTKALAAARRFSSEFVEFKFNTNGNVSTTNCENPIDDFFDSDHLILQTIDPGDAEKSVQKIEQKEENVPNVQSPNDFQFPFKPYPIQTEFMKNLFLCLENGMIGIFESPTGTGKSLSLICGVLTWLENWRRNEKIKSNEIISSAKLAKQKQNTSDDWLETYETTSELEERAKTLEREMKKYDELEEKLKLVKQKISIKYEPKNFTKRKTNSNDAEETQDTTDVEEVDNDCVLDEYFSEGEENLKDTDLDLVEKKTDDDNDEIYVTKIYYAVRTHSQLAQFMKELKKTPFAENVRAITLGSRQNLCVNESVKKLTFLNFINDRCLQLQKNSNSSSKAKKLNDSQRTKSSSSSCPYYRNQAIRNLSDQQLVKVQDIEQLVDDGSKSKACPYYASRYAVPSADVVLMPYQVLLNKSIRDSCNVRLKDSIIIIDEAHNLIDTINSIHSVKLTCSIIVSSCVQLELYKKRYETRLKAKNLFYIRQILKLLTSFEKVFKEKLSKPNEEKVFMLNDFIFDVDIADINIFKLLKYMEKSQISKKLNGFCHQKSVENSISTNICALAHVQSFLNCLTNPSKDGRIVARKGIDEETSWVKFISLNPSVYFKEILTEVRSVVLAGGTMQPVSDLLDQIFIPNEIREDRIKEFSCGHIIPDTNLLPLIICRGPSNVKMEFTYQNRRSPQLLNELGRILINLTNIIPGGLICFFSSYEYENYVYQKFFDDKTLEKLEERKKIFREPKKSSEVQDMLENYARCIKFTSTVPSKGRKNGAILFAVVGGKMSEGINFADDLGRCVLMIGMPYPSEESVELQEKMKFLNANFKNEPNQLSPGQKYYENLCIKAINQSIGRAIRHRNDYASIILLDYRYTKPSVQKKLPSWITRGGITEVNSFGTCLPNLKRFYDSCKQSCNL